jgi:hypothetical protein
MTHTSPAYLTTSTAAGIAWEREHGRFAAALRDVGRNAAADAADSLAAAPDNVTAYYAIVWPLRDSLTAGEAYSFERACRSYCTAVGHHARGEHISAILFLGKALDALLGELDMYGRAITTTRTLGEVPAGSVFLAHATDGEAVHVTTDEGGRLELGQGQYWPVYWPRIELDNRDRAIIANRVTRRDEQTGPRVGDYIIFANGVTRRISHIWFDEKAQTSDDGRFHLTDYGLSFGGSLYLPVPLDSLTDIGQMRAGSAWIFHHDSPGADRGVDFAIDCRVYTCTLPAPEV